MLEAGDDGTGSRARQQCSKDVGNIYANESGDTWSEIINSFNEGSEMLTNLPTLSSINHGEANASVNPVELSSAMDGATSSRAAENMKLRISIPS